jgi:hypothetical protein
MLAATNKFAQAKWLRKLEALLALSLLQLHQSAWSRRCWSRKCIYFMRERAAQLTPIDLSQPYMSTQLLPPWSQHTNSAVGCPLGDMPTKHAVPHLLALGVVLLELQMNGPITARTTNTYPDMKVSTGRPGQNFSGSLVLCSLCFSLFLYVPM